MTDKTPEEDTLAHHLEHLTMTADDLKAWVTRTHEEGEIHPEALAHSEKLAVGLRDVVHALADHPHLAASSADVWKMLTVKHTESGDGTIG